MKRKHSIRRRLSGIMMLTNSTAVLLVVAGFIISGLINFQNRLSRDLLTVAQVVGSNSTAALTFSDHQAAQKALNALRAKPSIIAAAIYTKHGVPFARYEPNASISIPSALQEDGFHGGGNRLELFFPIRLDKERIGTLYIVSDARDRNERLRQYVLIAAGISLCSLFIVFILSANLQRGISQPIVALARVARLISHDKNFSVRARHPRLNESEEIANLITGFNDMLAEIEQRDDRLLLHQTQLEETVALRTAELRAANEELLTAKNAAERAAELNAQLARQSALILNSATDGIFGVDVDSEPSFLNPAGARMLGRSLADLQGGKSIHQLIHHSRADGRPWPEGDCPLGLALLRGEAIATTDDTFWRPDGTCFPVEYSATPMLDEDGNKRGAVLIFRDVTERRAIERMKSEFVSTVSHELRTPLTSIRGALGLLGSGLLGPIAEKGQRMLDIAVGNTDRLVRLINDILDLERIESGKVELAYGAVEADAVLIHALEGVQAMADQAGVQLTVTPAAGTLRGDSDRIIQTLTNLLGNAIKFSPPATTVTLSAFARDNEFVFCVADEGRGVPDEKIEKIFERFSQVDASDARDKGGSGLGLAICRSIVNAHGGRIWAEKNEPVGSRFLFTIPLPARAALPAIAWPTPSDGPSILVVEDDLDLARVMTTALENRGFRTVHAATGNEAIQLCRQHEPSLIVLDLTLPDMDGFAVVDALRTNANLASLPLLVYSAMDVGSADQSLLRLGRTEFMTKSRCSLAEFVEHAVRLLGREEVEPAA